MINLYWQKEESLSYKLVAKNYFYLIKTVEQEMRIHPIPRCCTLRNQFRPRNQFHPIPEFRFHSTISTYSTTIDFQAIPETNGIARNSV
jgi:hypothetical protein